MILGKATETFNALNWQTLSLLNAKAIINSEFYVIRVKFPMSNVAAYYNVYQNNAPMSMNTGLTEETFKARLNAGKYAVTNNTYYQPQTPSVITPQTPVIDPGPGSQSGSGDLTAWFNDNQLYIYAAAAVLAAAFLFKKKK